MRLLYVLVLFSVLPFSSCTKSRIPVLIITDFGRDVDDAEAFAYLSSQNDIVIVGAVCTGYIPATRAKSLKLFSELLCLNFPIAIGSALPINIDDSTLINEYLNLHSINGIPYEYDLLRYLSELTGHIDNEYTFLEAEDLINDQLSKYPNSLRIVVLSQATDFAKYIQKNPNKTKFLHSIYIQGQALIINKEGCPSELIPDFDAYNLREDKLAAEQLFKIQNDIPFVIVGKYEAYKHVFTKKKFLEFANNYGNAGYYMIKAAELGLQNFLFRDEDTFRKVFNINDFIPSHEVLDKLDVISNPYDLVTVKTLNDLDEFVYKKVEQHIIIGWE